MFKIDTETHHNVTGSNNNTYFKFRPTVTLDPMTSTIKGEVDFYDANDVNQNKENFEIPLEELLYSKIATDLGYTYVP